MEGKRKLRNSDNLELNVLQLKLELFIKQIFKFVLEI